MKSFNRLTKQEKIEYLAILLLLPFAYIRHLLRKANFRTLSRRAVAVCLAVVMIAVMIPIISIPASATEYSGGSKVSVKALKSGDTIRKGTVIINGSDVTNVCRSFSPTDASGYQNMGSWWNEGSEWSADDNYYVVDVEQLSPIDPVYLYIYRIIETSAVTFYPAGGTIQGGTAAKTFTATKYLSDYCDVSWLTPGRPGCTFLGWYTSDGKEQVYNASGIAVNGSYWKNGIWQGQGAKSFIAKWKANTSVTFRYFPGGGSGQPDNFKQWTADATYFDTYSSDSHWNYTNGTYKLTRVGYTATGNYAKKDGSCVVHEDDQFTSYPQLCNAYGLNPDTCGNATIDIYAQWSPNHYTVNFDANGGTAVDSITAPYESNITLPTPTKAGHRFGGWQGNLKDIVTLTKGMEINDTSKGTIGENAGYAVTEYLVPLVGGATYTSNYEVCGLYSYDANGNFIKRESSYATTHTVSSNAAFVRVEVNISKGISFEEYQNNLTLTYTVPGGTTFRVGGNQTLTAQWSANTYTVTWKNYDGSVLETDTGVTYGTTPTYNGATPEKPEDENFTYTFKGWSPTVSAVTDDVVYTAEFTATSKRVEPSYTVTIPATVNDGESFKVSATEVVLNTDQTLTVTLQSDFTLTNEQVAELGFKINDGAIVNNTQLISVTGNGDKNTPLAKDSEALRIQVAEEVKYSGSYTGTITFTIAVNTAENN